MEVEPELSGDDFVGTAQAVADAPFLHDSEVEFVSVATERLPSHLDVAVRRDVDRRWRCGLLERQTQTPAAEDVPLLDTGLRLQPRELVLRLVRQPDLLDA